MLPVAKKSTNLFKICNSIVHRSNLPKFMLATTQGIVLRSVKYSETSLICDVYTRDWGLRTYIVHGVRQQKSRISQLLLRPTALVEMVVYHVADKDINKVGEIKPAYVYTRVPFEVIHGAVGLFMAELLQKTLKEAESNVSLFRFISDSFVALDNQTESLAAFHLIFMAQLTFFLGFAPNVETYEPDYFFDYKNGIFVADKPNHFYYFSQLDSAYLIDLLSTELAESHTVHIPKIDRHNLLEHLLDYYSFHTAGFAELQSYKVLQTVF